MKLIYIMDPLCGWCYGSSVNTIQLYEKYKNVLDFEILPAGMWTGTNVRNQSKQMAQYIKKHDLQVQHTTGTIFGEDYFKLIENENVILDSELPSRAIVAVKQLWAAELVSFVIEVQKARYLYGVDLNLDQTYMVICDQLKLDTEQFIEAYHSDFIKKATIETFDLAFQYASSYPTLIAEKNNKKIILEQGYDNFETIVNRIEQLIY